MLGPNFNKKFREESCEALEKIGLPAKDIAHTLAKVLLFNREPSVRSAAARGLQTLRYKDETVISTLKKAAANDSNSTVRAVASTALIFIKRK